MGNAGVTVYNSSKYPMNIHLSMGAMHHFCNRVQSKEAFTIYPGAVWYTFGCVLSNGRNDFTNAQCGTQIACIAVPVVLAVATGGLGFAAGIGVAGAAAVGSAIPGFASVAAIGEAVFGGALGLLGNAVVAIVAEAIAIGTATAIGAGGSAALTKILLENFKQVAEKCQWYNDIKGVYCGGHHKILIIEGGPYIQGDNWYPADITIKESDPNIIPSGTRYRKKNGLYNDDFQYWEENEKKWYPPNNFSK